MKEVFYPRSGKSFRERAGKKNRMNGQISLLLLLLLLPESGKGERESGQLGGKTRKEGTTGKMR